MCVVGRAEFASRCRDGVQYRLQVIGGARDDGEHLGGGSLVLKRLLQLALARLLCLEQSRVFDGDNGLVGEGLKELDLALSERSHFTPSDGDDTDSFCAAGKRDNQLSAETSPFCKVAANWVFLNCRLQISYLYCSTLDNSARHHSSTNQRKRTRGRN